MKVETEIQAAVPPEAEPSRLERLRTRLGGGPPARRQLAPHENAMGWLFVSPALIGLLTFLFLPILFALWVSFRQWSGITPPFQTEFIGLQNYRALLVDPGIQRTDFYISIRNNLYYVVGVVPTQTVIAFVLAVIVNQKFLRGKSFFRTAYYFPSITSSIAIALIIMTLFRTQGAINAILPFDAINWLNNANGVIHNLLGALGVREPPGVLVDTRVLGLTLWDWMAGPSVTLSMIMLLNIWTTIGTFMLIFLAALQNISSEVEEAATVDGAGPVQRFFYITVPLMKPAIFFVMTLGLIGTWQVFDQIFVISFGGPQKTTITPAFLVYLNTFENFRAGMAAALSVVLFLIIAVFTVVQRRITREELY